MNSPYTCFVERQFYGIAQSFLGALACLLVSNVAGATDHFVSTSGSSSGDGSITSPWDSQTALNQPASVQPGDTIWVMAGTYQSLPAGSYGFTSNLNGTASSPIIVRNYNGGRATIDGMSDNVTLAIEGSYTWFWGLEIMSSVANRVSSVSGSFGMTNALGVASYGPGIKCINMVVHDTAQGFSSYNSSPNSEFSGNLVYYNGWIGPDRNHGHGFYLQNSTGTKLVSDNFSGDNADEGTQMYGSGSAQISGITYTGNGVYNNSSWPNAQYQYNILLGGGNLDTDNTISNNYFYFTPTIISGYNAIGIYTPGNNLTVTNNIFAGGYIGFSSNGVAAPFTFTGNEIYVSPSVGELWTVQQGLLSGQSSSGYNWDYNNYYGLGVFEANCFYDGSNASGCNGGDFSNWQTTTGFDSHGSYSNSAPTGTQVFVTPNQYEAKRANIVIYNWNLSPTVAVDLSSILTVGDQYVIQDAQNFYGPAPVVGTYSGDPIQIPMTELAKATPIGFAAPPHTAPEYGTFVVTVPGAAAGTSTAPSPTGSPLTINTTSLPSGETTVAFGAPLQASGGTAPYSWSITGLPSGLTVSTSTGMISGTPAQSGQYSISVSVTDSTADAANTTLSLSIALAPPVSSGSSQILVSVAVTPSNPSMNVGATQQFTATGTYQDSSTQDITWQVTWSSSSTAVMILANGLSTGQSAGSAAITATLSGIVGSANVSVQPTAVSLGAVPNTSWALVYADSQETQCENGAAVNGFDGNPATMWHTQYCPSVVQLPHEIQIDTGTGYLISGFSYLPRQDGGVNGRIGQYEFYATNDLSNWGSPLATGSFTNDATAKQVLFAANTYRYIRLRALTEANGGPWTSMAELTVWQSVRNTPILVSVAVTPSNPSMMIGANQQFTATGTYQDGSAQDITSQVTWSSSNTTVLILASGLSTGQSAGSATITATLSGIVGSANVSVQPTAVFLTAVPNTNWALVFADSHETQCENGAAVNGFDGNPATMWHTQYCPSVVQLPHEIQIDMGTGYLISGFSYLPRQDGGVNGRIGQYEFYATNDLSNWGSPLATGSFANDATAKQVLFAANTYRYIRLRALTEANGGPWTSMAELTVWQSVGSH